MKLRITIWALCALMLAGARAEAAQCTQFHSWQTGEVITALLLNGMDLNDVACANNINWQNIGTGGIYASQVQPTSASQGTFGGTSGYIFGPYNSSVVPFQVIQGSGAIADVAQFFINGGAQKVVWIDSTGNFNIVSNLNIGSTILSGTASNFAGTLSFNNGSALSVPTRAAVWADNAAIAGLFFNVPTSSTNGYRFGVNGVSVASINTSGTYTVGSSVFGYQTGSIIQVNSDTNIPLTVNGNSASQSADLLRVNLSAGSANPTMRLTSLGTLYVGNQLAANGTMSYDVVASATNSYPSVGQTGSLVSSSSAGAGMLVMGGTTLAGLLEVSGTCGTGTFCFRSQTGSMLAVVASSLGIAASNTSSAASPLSASYVPPMITSAGASVGPTAHIITGTCTFAAATTCTPTAWPGPSGGLQASFTSASTFACNADWTTASAVTITTQNNSGTSVTFTAGASNSLTVAYVCTGT